MRPIASHLDRANLVNKGFIVWLSGKSCLRYTAGSPKRARRVHLAHSGSQSQRAIWVILPARGASHMINICYLPAGRSVLGKTVPEVLSTARGRRPTVVPTTEGTVFPNTDRPRPANNVFIIFFRRVLCKQFFCWIFTAAIFKPGVRVRLTFRT